jgi:hypothetical protein
MISIFASILLQRHVVDQLSRGSTVRFGPDPRRRLTLVACCNATCAAQSQPVDKGLAENTSSGTHMTVGRPWIRRDVTLRTRISTGCEVVDEHHATACSTATEPDVAAV